MLSLSGLIDQVRDYLVQTGGQQPRHEVYSHFINECKTINLTEEAFYKEVLKPASKSIDWEVVEREKKEKAEQDKRDQESTVKEAAEQTALVYIHRQIKALFESGVLEAAELKNIFQKAEASGQNVFQLADYVEAQVNKYQFRPFPAADITVTLFDVKGKLLSTNWYDNWHYNKLSASSPTVVAAPQIVAPPQ